MSAPKLTEPAFQPAPPQVRSAPLHAELGVAQQARAVPPRAACACGGICPRCQPSAAALRGRDFSSARVHPEAAEVTGPLRARAATIGQDVYFHPGQYRPGTPEGEALLAHELAHTLQTKASAGDEAGTTVAAPDDALERNAQALARGATAHALPAPAGTVLRSPFDNESAGNRARRETLIQSIDNAAQTLIRMLQNGGLIRGAEAAVTRGGVRGIINGVQNAGTPNENFQTYAQRETRLRRVIRGLQAMATQYRSAPLPADFSAPVHDPTQGNYASTVQHPPGSGISSADFVAQSKEWADLQAAYERHRILQGWIGGVYESDWLYLEPDAVIDPGAARGAPRLGGGIQTGVYMVVPDIDREPLRYWRLTGTSPAPRGSTIVELWHDSLGYYYLHRGQRIDVPSPWR